MNQVTLFRGTHSLRIFFFEVSVLYKAKYSIDENRHSVYENNHFYKNFL